MKITRFLVIAVLLVPAVAPAQIDPDPNGVGIYFDLGATQVTAAASPGADGIITVTAYLVATRLVATGEVGCWSASFGTTPWGVSPDCWSWVSGGPTVGFNYVQNMPGSNHWGFMVLVDPLEHLPIGPAVVLASLGVYAQCAGRVDLYIDNAELAALGGPVVPLHPLSGAWNLPVAVINGEAPVPAVTAAWGAVKRLYGH